MTEQKPPMALAFVGSLQLVGPCQDVVGDPDRRVTVEPVYEHRGSLVIGPASASGEQPVGTRRSVVPVGGLVSLRTLTVRPDAVVLLSELAREERLEIEREYDRCDEMMADFRSQLAGVSAPRKPSGLVLPGRG
jgi:hypothetical protein